MKNDKTILFEGHELKKSEITNIWQLSSMVLVQLQRLAILAVVYDSVELATLGKKYLLNKMGR